MQNSENQKIRELSQQIQINPENQLIYKQRSEQYALNGNVDMAVQDLSKSLFLDQTCESYIKRGKLYASSDFFTYALLDFEQAESLYQKDKEKYCKSKQTKEFIEKSICIQKIPEMKSIVKQYEKSQKQLKNQEITELKCMLRTIMETNSNVEEQLKKQKEETKQKMKKFEEQMKCYEQLQQFQEKEICRLKNCLQDRPPDFEEIFNHQIENSTMSAINKDRCSVYYKCFVSEMEEYYLVAKVTKNFDEKKFKFEDFKEEQIEKNKKAKYFVEKLFVLFDRYSSKISQIQGVIKEIPYIGAAFKVIKSAAKGFGWFQNVKIQHQCENIVHLRTNITSFNKFSTKLGYLMYKNYKISISQADHALYEHTNWEKINKKYKEFKKTKVKNRLFPHLNQKQYEYVREMAETHVAIIMVGVAYGVFKFSENFDEESKLEELFLSLDKIQEKLKVKSQIEEEAEELQIIKEEEKSSKCSIF